MLAMMMDNKIRIFFTFFIAYTCQTCPFFPGVVQESSGEMEEAGAAFADQYGLRERLWASI